MCSSLLHYAICTLLCFLWFNPDYNGVFWQADLSVLIVSSIICTGSLAGELPLPVSG